MMAISLSVVALLTIASSPGSGTRVGDPQDGSVRLYLTPEVFSYGGRAELPSDGSDGMLLRIASIDLKWRRLRVGTSLVEAGYGIGSLSVLPVRLGYTIWEKPRRYLGRLYGMVPEFFLQASATPWPRNGQSPPYDRFVGHAEVRAAADIFGVGLGVGAGVVARYGNTFASTSYSWAVRPTVDASIRLGVTNFGL